MTPKEQAIKEANERISQYQQSIEMLNLLPDGPFDYLVDVAIRDDTIYIELPFDVSILRDFRRKMGNGWKCNSWSITSHDGYATKSICYYPANRRRWDGPTILLTLNPTLNGATCQAVKVGVIEKPVYEIVCQ